jgi:hypothetical protein
MNTTELSAEDLNQLKRRLEAEAAEKLKQQLPIVGGKQQTASTNPGQVCMDIMQAGAQEFKEKTGRNMTYSEMREMFG